MDQKEGAEQVLGLSCIAILCMWAPFLRALPGCDAQEGGHCACLVLLYFIHRLHVTLSPL